MKRMYVCRFIVSIIFASIISLLIMSCDLNGSGDTGTVTSLEGSWGNHFHMDIGEFTFTGNNFTYSVILSPRRKGTFTRSGSSLTFYSTHEWAGLDGWVPLTSPPTHGMVRDHLSFLDSGDPVNFRFERWNDGTLRGVYIGSTLFLR